MTIPALADAVDATRPDIVQDGTVQDGTVAFPEGLTARTPAASAGAVNPALSGLVVRYHSGGVGGLEIQPESNLDKAKNARKTFHTNLRYIVPPNGQSPVPPSRSAIAAALDRQSRGAEGNVTLPGSNAGVNTPASLACVYALAAQPAAQPAGCNPYYASVNPSGGIGAIALVDAYDNPTAEADLAVFSTEFGLPAANFNVVYASGTQPSGNADWNLEASLDVQWAHAMAPSAKIFLVEAADNTAASLYGAVQAAQALVAANGGGEVSMSFGATEDSTETSYDTVFSGAPSNVTQVASAGDTGSVPIYPSTSPYVVSAGGTSIARDGANNYVTETAWSDGGGGDSAYEARPGFQSALSVRSLVGSYRGTPDVAMLADPNTGVWVYLAGSWYIVGGTSLSAPLTAGVLNLRAGYAGNFPVSFAAGVQGLYNNGLSHLDSRDIASGSCGTNRAAVGYDFCTGMGSLVSFAAATPSPPTCTGTSSLRGLRSLPCPAGNPGIPGQPGSPPQRLRF